MFKIFETYLAEKAKLTEKELRLIESLSIRKKLRKKQYLLKEGEVCRYHTFITKGCMRIYRLSEYGTEHITKFAVENWWISDRESLLSGKPATSYIDAIENTEVLQWTNENFEILFNEIPEFDALFKRLVSRALNASTNRINTLITSTAEAKFNAFIKRYPDVFSRVPQHMIASYLGITRETLSRVRKQFTSA